MSSTTGPLPLTDHVFYAIDWWQNSAKPDVIHGRHADRGKASDCLITLGADDRITVSKRRNDAFEDAYVEAAREADPGTIRQRAIEAERAVDTIAEKCRSEGLTKSSAYRKYVLDMEAMKCMTPLSDRVAATSLTVRRARTLITSYLSDHPAYDYPHRKEATPAGKPSIDLGEISATAATPAEPEPASRVAATPAVPDEAARARAVLAAIDIDLDALVADLAPTPAAPATGKAHVASAAFDVPASNPHFCVPTGSAWHDAFEALDLAHAAGSRKNLLVTGPTGCGKTEGANHYAATRKRPAITIDCTQLVEPTDAFGAMIAESGTTRFVPSAMTEALATTDAVVILDEVNRAHPKVLNSLFSILDGRGSARIDCVLDGNGDPIEVQCASNVVIVMTANIGASYRGAQRMDDAFINRADCTVRVDYLTAAQECKLLTACTGISKPDADVISKLATWTRSESSKLTGGAVSSAASTRKSVCAARMVAEGLPVARACKLAVVDCYHDDTERAAATSRLIALAD
jgi:MoxR-like ATPase